MSRSVRGLAFVALTAASFYATLPLSTAAAAAGVDPKVESEAKKLQDDAMDIDFLSLDYTAAKKKLDLALSKCGKAKCGSALIASLHRDIGIVAINIGDLSLGDTEFKAAVTADATVKMPRDYLDKAEVKTAWEAATKTTSTSTPTTAPTPTATVAPTPTAAPPKPDATPSSTDGGLVVKVKKAAIGVELPLWIDLPDTLPDGVVVASVKVSYKTDGQDRFKPIEAHKNGARFLAILPCDVTEKAGSLKFYVRAFDADGSELDHYASLKKPASIDLVTKLGPDDDVPLLADDQEPQKCEPASAVSAKKPEGSGCELDDECADGLSCNDKPDDEGKKWCVAGPHQAPAAVATPLAHRLWVGLDGDIDFFFVGSANALCGSSNWACSVDQGQGAGRQVVGTNASSSGIAVQPGATTAGSTSGGFATGTKRVLVSADYFVTSNTTLGVRLGYAFGGNPTDAPKTMPYHAEARLQIFFHDKLVRPYALLAGGLAEFDPKVTQVSVLTAGSGTQINGIDAYHLVGTGFVAVGGGAWVLLGDRAAINIGIKALFPLPTFTFGIAPEIGVKVGF